MNAKEKRQEEQELQKAVSVLRATLRSIANRKACRYDQEIGDQAIANELSADFTAREVKQEITKQ